MKRNHFMKDRASIYSIIATLFLLFSLFTIYLYRSTSIKMPAVKIANSQRGNQGIQLEKNITGSIVDHPSE